MRTKHILVVLALLAAVFVVLSLPPW